jgi:CelD/BcsL family acetyltransferase involved in cellulose biosynthesis
VVVPAHNPELGAYSPGLVLVMDLGRAMTEEGISLLDLGNGDEA